MTFKELEIFFILSENENVKQTAQMLHLTQPAVSLAIKSLEKELNTKLFDRIGKKLVLNENGRFFKEKSYTHFLALKESEKLFIENRVIGELNIAMSKTIGNFYMPKIILEFLNMYPKVAIKREITNSSNIIKKILNGETDMGFVEVEFDDVNIIKEKIAVDELIVVSAERDLSRRKFFIDELFEKKWILREPGSGTREMFIKSLGDMKKDFKVFLQSSEIEEIKNLLLSDKSLITCISEYAVKNELKTSLLYKVKLRNFEIKRNFYLIYHKNKYQSIIFKEFKKFSNFYTN